MSTYEPYPGGAPAPEPSDGEGSRAGWQVLVEATAGALEPLDGAYATRAEAVERARAEAFAHRPPVGYRRRTRRVYREGDGFVTTFGEGQALAVRFRVVWLEGRR